MAAGSPVMNILKIVLCVLLPPVAVYLDKPGFDDTLIISIILTICAWLPGILFAFWTVFFGGRDKVKLMDVIMFLCCVILPPLGVYLKQKAFTIDFVISILLCFLAWFPASIFAVLVYFFGFTCKGKIKSPVQS